MVNSFLHFLRCMYIATPSTDPTLSPTFLPSVSPSKFPSDAPSKTPSVVLDDIFSDSYLEVYIHFNVTWIHLLTSSLCSEIFDVDSNKLLGNNAICSWNLFTKTIKIILKPTSIIQINDILTIKNGIFEWSNDGINFIVYIRCASK